MQPTPEVVQATAELTQALLRAVLEQPESGIALNALFSTYIFVSRASGRPIEVTVADLHRGIAMALATAQAASPSSVDNLH